MMLSSLRREIGLNQRQVAGDLGISQALLSHYENSAREPKLEFVVRACDYYDVSVDYILGRDCEKKPKVLPVPQGCAEAESLISAAHEVFDMLAEIGDPELSLDVVRFLILPLQNIADSLRDPTAPYDPSRDIRLKQAEAKYIESARQIHLPDGAPIREAPPHKLSQE